MYKLYKNSFDGTNIQKTNEDGSVTSFYADPANTDYQAYLKWIEACNTPEPADEPE